MNPSGKRLKQSIGGIALSGVIGFVGYPFPSGAQATTESVPPPTTTPTIPVVPASPPVNRSAPPKRQMTWPLPPVPTTTVAPIQVEDGYLLGPGDRVRIDIFNVPEYTGESQVLSDGNLNLPLIGAVPVSGMNLKQTAAELEQRYSRFLKRPIITVTVTASRPINLAVAGEVNRPGTYGPGPAGTPTVTRLITQAGGITQAADIRNVQIRRPRIRDRGTDQVIVVDLWKLIQEGDLRQDLILRDGDTVFVPTNTDIKLAEATQLANANFANTDARPLNIAVVGEVARPGPYRITVDNQNKVPTVTRAIQQAGGITQLADIRNIEVRRPTKNGPEQIINVNFWQLLKSGDLKQDIPLQEGDTVAIPLAKQINPNEVTELAAASFSPATITINVVGEVTRPGVVQVPPNTPLNQALLAAGGFSQKADSGTVELIRLNPNGTVTKSTIAVNFAQGVNEANNPALRNNDTVVVNKSGIIAFGEGAGAILGPLLGPITGIYSLFRLLGGF